MWIVGDEEDRSQSNWSSWDMGVSSDRKRGQISMCWKRMAVIGGFCHTWSVWNLIILHMLYGSSVWNTICWHAWYTGKGSEIRRKLTGMTLGSAIITLKFRVTSHRLVHHITIDQPTEQAARWWWYKFSLKIIRFKVSIEYELKRWYQIPILYQIEMLKKHYSSDKTHF